MNEVKYLYLTYALPILGNLNLLGLWTRLNANIYLIHSIRRFRDKHNKNYISTVQYKFHVTRNAFTWFEKTTEGACAAVLLSLSNTYDNMGYVNASTY